MEVGKVEEVEKVESDGVRKREKICALEKLKETGEVETTEEKADAVEKLKETGQVETTEEKTDAVEKLKKTERAEMIVEGTDAVEKIEETGEADEQSTEEKSGVKRSAGKKRELMIEQDAHILRRALDYNARIVEEAATSIQTMGFSFGHLANQVQVTSSNFAALAIALDVQNKLQEEMLTAVQERPPH